jgi:hypothetical protein
LDIGQAFPAPPGAANVVPDSDGFVWINPKKFGESFCQDLPPDEQLVMAVTQKAPFGGTFANKVTRFPHGAGNGFLPVLVGARGGLGGGLVLHRRTMLYGRILFGSLAVRHFLPVMLDNAPGSGSHHGMMTCDVTDHAADCGALQTAFGVSDR